jgi:hypothetical protein
MKRCQLLTRGRTAQEKPAPQAKEPMLTILYERDDKETLDTSFDQQSHQTVQK